MCVNDVSLRQAAHVSSERSGNGEERSKNRCEREWSGERTFRKKLIERERSVELEATIR